VLARPPGDLRVAMLGRFRLVARDSELAISGGSQRLVAFLALRSSWVKRALIAGTLWPDTSEGRAHASLRSTLSRMDRDIRGSIEVTQERLRLAAHVTVDLVSSKALAQRLIAPNGELADGDVSPSAIAALSADLLPDWYDDWVLLEVEDWRQVRLHALEALSKQFMHRRLFADAALAALAAVKADPLRESPHATLMRVHLVEGNQSEALRVYARYRELLRSELGIAPSRGLHALIDGIERLGGDTVTPR